MTKTIVISIVTSAMLFGATVNDLTTDQVNKVENSANIDNATINQGKVDINGGTTSVNSYYHGGATGDGSNTNTIKGTVINGAEGSDGSVKVDQGGLTISGGAVVSNSQDHSENTITNGTIDSTSTSGGVAVKQGDIDINGGEYSNMDIHSINNITGANIQANGEGSTLVTQATLTVSDANVSDSAEATNVDLTSTNTIEGGGLISNSTVKQSDTVITGSSSVVSGLNVNQTNIINTGEAIKNGSTVTQATTKINDSTFTEFTETVTNTMTNVAADGSTLKQNDITVTGGSHVSGFTNNTNGDHGNTMDDVTATNGATLTQNTTTIDSSTVDDMTSTQENYMKEITANGSYNVKQGDISLTNAVIDGNLEVDYHNEMERVDMIGAGSVSQGTLTIGDSNATGTVAESIDIKSVNKLTDTDLENTNVAQSSTSILAGSSVSGFKLDQTNTIDKTEGEADNNMTGATISQAEMTISGSTVDTMEQTVTNTITDATLNDAHVYQAKVDISESDVDNVTISSTTNSITGSTVDEATISQNGLKIENSSVDGLTIEQTNTIDNATVSGAATKLTQGDVNIY